MGGLFVDLINELFTNEHRIDNNNNNNNNIYVGLSICAIENLRVSLRAVCFVVS
jgi:hypothetical protein